MYHSGNSELEQLEDWTIDIQYVPTIDVNTAGIVYSPGVQFSYTDTNK